MLGKLVGNFGFEPKMFKKSTLSQKVLEDMKEATEALKKSHPDMGEMVHGISKNGTIGGIANLGNGKISYCLKPDESTMVKYFNKQKYYLTGNAYKKNIEAFINTEKGAKTKRTTIEFWGEDANIGKPTNILEEFFRTDGTTAKRLRYKTDNNKITEITMPSGKFIKTIKNEAGDTVLKEVKLPK